MFSTKKIMLVPHCIFHRQSICSTAAQGEEAFGQALQWIEDENYFMFPIPCPRLTYKNETYSNITPHDTHSLTYRIHCRDVIKPLVDHLKTLNFTYGNSLGTIGLQGSSTCDTINGILMNELHKQLLKNDIAIDIEWYIPNRISPTFNPIEHYIQHN